MRKSPISAVDSYSSLQFINYRVDAKRWTNKFRDAFALLVNRITVQQTSTNSCFTTASFKIESEHMRSLDSLSGSQTGTNGLASASEPCEVVKVDSSQQNYPRKLSQGLVDLNGNACLGNA